MTDMKTGVELIAEERKRQISTEGWTSDHDDEYQDREMARAAECYVHYYRARSWIVETSPDNLIKYRDEPSPDDWPWEEKHWKPKDPKKDLIRAGALIAAEIDRLNRMDSK